MYILSLSIGLSIHNYVNFWRNHFKISKVVVEKRTSGCRSITSSIYLNLNISVIYYRIKIKLVLEKAEWQCLYIRTFLSHFRSRRHDVIKHSIADIPLKLRWIEPQFGHRYQGSPWCHLKYHVILKVTLTLWVNCKVNAYYFFLVWCAVHNFVYSLSNHFQFSTVVVEKGNFRLHRYDVINIFKLAYLLYLKSDWAQTSFSKIGFIICICILTWYAIKLTWSLTKWRKPSSLIH